MQPVNLPKGHREQAQQRLAPRPKHKDHSSDSWDCELHNYYLEPLMYELFVMQQKLTDTMITLKIALITSKDYPEREITSEMLLSSAASSLDIPPHI